jgi:bifunctional UDP-N-acetylglucosamine pyrophosphorylase/glucosamine-1-phosphate N-acetyltransferase
MKSKLPKVLHELGGQPLIEHVIKVAQSLGATRKIVVVGHQAQEVQAALSAYPDLTFALQVPQLGTGHAVQMAQPHVSEDGLTLVLSGDVPLITPETLAALLKVSEGKHLTLLTLNASNPYGYGRVLKQQSGLSDHHAIVGIVEEKDANETQRLIQEVYTGVMVIPNVHLKVWLDKLNNQNAQKEYYLTDLVKIAVESGHRVLSHQTHDAVEVSGVNDPAQLAFLERAHQERIAHVLMLQGVRLADPKRIDVRGDLVCGQEVSIDVGCVFEGRVSLASDVHVGAYCVLRNVDVAAGVSIKPFTHIEGGIDAKDWVRVGEGAQLGPFSRLRAGTRLDAQVHVGNFVEIKNSSLGVGSKANHLAYIGDAEVGARVNYGAGSITANYDGANKHKTTIEDDVHVGSNSVLVAPLTLGAGGTVGAGSTVTKDTAKGALTVSRAKSVSLPNWSRPTKKDKT